MHEQQFALAVLPEPPRLFRLQLKPYSIGHELHLYRRKSPFLLKSKVEFDDMAKDQRLVATMQAIHVCFQDFEDNRKKSGGWRLWMEICQWYPLDDTANQFREYMIAGRTGFKSDLPTGDDPNVKIRFLGAPELLRHYQFICDTVPEREIGLYSRRRTAWDYPMALAMMHSQARAELAGELSVYNWKDKALDDYIAEQESAAAKEKETDA